MKPAERRWLILVVLAVVAYASYRYISIGWICPACGSARVYPILYGDGPILADWKTKRLLSAEEVGYVRDGCCGGRYDRYCDRCGLRWNQREPWVIQKAPPIQDGYLLP